MFLYVYLVYLDIKGSIAYGMKLPFKIKGGGDNKEERSKKKGDGGIKF